MIDSDGPADGKQVNHSLSRILSPADYERECRVTKNAREEKAAGNRSVIVSVIARSRDIGDVT